MLKLAHVIDELVEEKGLDRSILSSIIAEGIEAAYAKKFPDQSFQVIYNKKNDELEVRAKKSVVAVVENDLLQIGLRKARAANPEVELGQEIWLPFEEKIGRIEILRAKQVIAARIRGIEAEAVFNEYKDKKGTIVQATIHKCERGGVTLKLGDALAFLPKSLSIPTDKCVIGYSLRALLKEVLPEPKNDYQLILDRSSCDFVSKLFELEIPEIFEELVIIKKIVRIPGYKTKVAVSSNDKNIDPVGTCIGAGGARIRPMIEELSGEKIDVIAWVDSAGAMVANALKPAIVNRVELVGDGLARVWLDEDQRSLAIGRMGQNIALASQLVGMDINLMGGEKKPDSLVDGDFSA